MANFTTLANMKVRYDDRTLIKLSDDAGAGLIASACVNAIITKATGYIKRYISKRYSTSAAASGGALESICEEVTLVMLHQRRGLVPQNIWENHRANVQYLEDVMNGIADLPDQSTSEDVFLSNIADNYNDSGAGILMEFLDEDSDDYQENP